MSDEKKYNAQEIAIAVLNKVHEMLKKSELLKANTSHEIESGEEPRNDDAECPEYLENADFQDNSKKSKKDKKVEIDLENDGEPEIALEDEDSDGDVDEIEADVDDDGDMDIGVDEEGNAKGVRSEDDMEDEDYEDESDMEDEDYEDESEMKDKKEIIENASKKNKEMGKSEKGIDKLKNFLAKAEKCDLKKEYIGFNKLKNKIAHKKGVKNAAAIAAAIGRKKYGKKAFQQAAAKGKKMEKVDNMKGVAKPHGFRSRFKGSRGTSNVGRDIRSANESKPSLREKISSALGVPGPFNRQEKKKKAFRFAKEQSKKRRIETQKLKTNLPKDKKMETMDPMYKKQGVPKGADPVIHERCVKDLKAQGKDKSSAYAICNAAGAGKKKKLKKAKIYDMGSKKMVVDTKDAEKGRKALAEHRGQTLKQFNDAERKKKEELGMRQKKSAKKKMIKMDPMAGGMKEPKPTMSEPKPKIPKPKMPKMPGSNGMKGY